MGCDIHIYLEQRIEPEWVFIHEFDIMNAKIFGGGRSDYYHPVIAQRDYSFFGAIASVRSAPIGHQEPRGMPIDASRYVKWQKTRWGEDAHSASYMSAAEFLPIFMQHKLTASELSEVMATRLLGDKTTFIDVMSEYICQLYSDCIDDYRFVFFFDN